jgi:hypothetical protein
MIIKYTETLHETRAAIILCGQPSKSILVIITTRLSGLTNRLALEASHGRIGTTCSNFVQTNIVCMSARVTVVHTNFILSPKEFFLITNQVHETILNYKIECKWTIDKSRRIS